MAQCLEERLEMRLEMVKEIVRRPVSPLSLLNNEKPEKNSPVGGIGEEEE